MKLNKPLTSNDVLEILGNNIKVLGNINISITGINEIHCVEKGDITFVDHPKYYIKALSSKASFILIDKEPEDTFGKTLFITDDPFRDYVKLVKHVTAFVPQNSFIHLDAIIGEGTVLQPGVFVGQNVKIGKNCIIHSNVSIYNDTTIGDNVIIHSNSVIGGDAFYFKRREHYWDKLESCGSTSIGNNVEIGALCTIDKGVSSDTSLGEGCKLDNHIQIGHDTKIGKNVLIGAHCAIAGVVTIEDNCLIWAKVSINKDLVVARGTTLLATSAIDKSTKPNQVLFGAPAIDYRKKWREMAAMRMLPDILDDLIEMKSKMK
ncbi:MAG: UDP-3-O-(3-hydroxymyristoyl)glucosamine N-acyltransferase [Bacteroidales bacterium]|nr:UDP-3-O-(3-hydroxymyristoyl)glucosamine N-acyltransferase [Bacteroidales bacterium]